MWPTACWVLRGYARGMCAATQFLPTHPGQPVCCRQSCATHTILKTRSLGDPTLRLRRAQLCMGGVLTGSDGAMGLLTFNQVQGTGLDFLKKQSIWEELDSGLLVGRELF